MDASFLLMLSNLLHLHNYLDPSSSLLSDPSPPPSPSPSLSLSSSSSSAAPLLFFALASVLSYASSSLSSPHARSRRRSRSRSGKRLRSSSASSSSPSPSSPARPSRPLPPPSASAFFLSVDRILSMDPAARDARCRSLYGLSYPVFATLLDSLRPLLLPLRLPVPPHHALPLALARLSRGLSPRALAHSLSLPPALVARAAHAVTRLLATRLYADYVKPPTPSRLLETLQSFRDIAALPNLAGAIASSPVRLKKRLGLGDPHDDPFGVFSPGRRTFPAVLLQAVADHRRIFWDASVRAPGSADPASHLRDSSLYARLAAGEILRDPAVTVRGHSLRPYLAGAASYPLLPFLLTPFSSASAAASSSAAGSSSSSLGITPAEQAFDAALAKARAASVEPAIALLKGRWRILRNLDVGLNHAAQTVVACVVLHNICQIAGEAEDDGRYLWRDPPETPQPVQPAESEQSLYYFGESLRQALADDLYERQQKLSGPR